MIRQFDTRDLGEVARMDGEWTVESYAPFLDYDGYTGRVLVESGRIIGAIVYRFNQFKFAVHRVVVAEMVRRRGHGTALIEHLQMCLSPDRQSHITCEVYEYDLASQLFLRERGFRWTRTECGHYRMEFWLSDVNVWRPTNRIATEARA